MSSEPVQFYFDFSSPYGHLAAQRIDGIAERHGRQVEWRPIVLGGIFKETGGRPLTEMGEHRWRYAQRDVARAARFLSEPFSLPPVFPFSGVAATRAYYRIAHDDRFVAHDFAQSVFAAAFTRGNDVSQPAVLARIAAGHGIDPEVLAADIAQDAWKLKAREETDAALAAGVFGSPFFLVDGEPFWGNDRLAEVDAWLASGGW